MTHGHQYSGEGLEGVDGADDDEFAFFTAPGGTAQGPAPDPPMQGQGDADAINDEYLSHANGDKYGGADTSTQRTDGWECEEGQEVLWQAQESNQMPSMSQPHPEEAATNEAASSFPDAGRETSPSGDEEPSDNPEPMPGEVLRRGEGSSHVLHSQTNDRPSGEEFDATQDGGFSAGKEGTTEFAQFLSHSVSSDEDAKEGNSYAMWFESTERASGWSFTAEEEHDSIFPHSESFTSVGGKVQTAPESNVIPPADEMQEGRIHLAANDESSESAPQQQPAAGSFTAYEGALKDHVEGSSAGEKATDDDEFGPFGDFSASAPPVFQADEGGNKQGVSYGEFSWDAVEDEEKIDDTTGSFGPVEEASGGTATDDIRNMEAFGANFTFQEPASVSGEGPEFSSLVATPNDNGGSDQGAGPSDDRTATWGDEWEEEGFGEFEQFHSATFDSSSRDGWGDQDLSTFEQPKDAEHSEAAVRDPM